MDAEQFPIATQSAQHLCNRVSRRAIEVGFFDGMITAVRHQGDVSRVHLDLFDAQGTRPDQRQLITPCRCAGLAEAQRLLRNIMQEELEGCIVRFGSVAMLFSKGVLRHVTVTEKFKIEEEIAELGRIFLPPAGSPLNGRRPRRTPGSGNGSQA